MPNTAAAGWRLERRLAWRLAAVMVAAIAVAGAAVAWRTLATIRSLDDAALQSQARLVAAQLVAGPNGRPVLHMPGQLAAAFRESDGGNMFIVFDAQGAPVASSAPASLNAILPFVPQPPQNGFFRVLPFPNYPDGLLGVAIAAGPWRVVVAQAQEQNEALVESLLREFLTSALWLLAPIGAATVLIGVLTIRQSLRPLRAASAAAARIGPDRLAVRLPTAELPGELLPLVGAVNAAVARLEQALAAQRRFVASAAHALRTPLAVLTARIDMLDAGPEAPALRADVDRLSRLIGQMLTMARLEEVPLDVSGTLDLHRAAVEAVGSLAPLAIRRHIELALTEPPNLQRIPGNQAAVVLALTNLLDNALAYAPPGSTVDIEIASPATLRVLDRGPGVAEAERAAMFERFHRAAGAHPGGSGLGLAIVAEICAAHGGGAGLEPRDGGGTVAVLRLAGAIPAASDP